MSKWKFNKDGWTDWITHDGSGCPCVGYYINLESSSSITSKALPSNYRLINDRLVEGIPVSSSCHGSWYWLPDLARVLRYRIRKPKGLTMLENLLEELPEVVKEDMYEQA